ncbi:MAG: NDP-hexose 2,3-dehydratase family protein [FCB group bacterium]|nr:NDP-hexose 2,3-dehydratase family protein [FCB group bacterium]
MNTRRPEIERDAEKLRRRLEQALHFSGDSPQIDFYISALTEYNPFHTTEEVQNWLESLNKEERFHVTLKPISELHDWYFDEKTGDLCHKSGGFFSIRGLEVHTNIGPVEHWTQPIIDQPEIGVLGIITKKINGILYFLMQAKAEPGNINTFQIAPTVQSTRSNFMRLHNGKSTRYIDYFINGRHAEILIDQLQSEQGARFFQKRNRNVIIRIPDDEEIDLSPNYKWLTLGQLKKLMRRDNTVNMDARSVISSIAFSPQNNKSKEQVEPDMLKDCLETSALTEKPISDLKIKLMLSECCQDRPAHCMDELLRIISYERFQCRLHTSIIPLKEVKDWICAQDKIYHRQNKYFEVIGVHVEASNREVACWDQPIIRQRHEGKVGFIIREINGILHFLVQLKLESGNIDILGLAPTVQCITGSYGEGYIPEYAEEILNPERCRIILDTMQSEEGGRFYHEANRNLILLGDDSFPLKTPQRYLWMTLKQLKELLKYNNYLNVETRSLLALV